MRRQSPRRKRSKKAQPPGPARKSFRATPAMMRFLLTELELLSKRRPYTQKSVAELAKVSEFQASRWHEVPGYDDWHAEQLHCAAVRLFNRAKIAVGYRILMTGDPKELETFGRVLGIAPAAAADPDGNGSTSAGMVMNFLIPRPETPVIPGVTVRELSTSPAEPIPTVDVR